MPRQPKTRPAKDASCDGRTAAVKQITGSTPQITLRPLNGARASTHVAHDAAHLSDTAWRPRIRGDAAAALRITRRARCGRRRRRSARCPAHRARRRHRRGADEGGAQGRRAAQGGESRRRRRGDGAPRNLIFSNLYRIEDGATQISVEDWENGGEVVEITLSPKFRSAKDEADAGFKKARRLRRGSAVVEELLEASSAKSTVLEGLRGDAVDADDDALEMLERRAAKKGATVGPW